MKKLIIYGAGIWAERLLTVERYKKVDYFVDENADTGKILMPGSEWEKQIYKPDVLTKENDYVQKQALQPDFSIPAGGDALPADHRRRRHFYAAFQAPLLSGHLPARHRAAEWSEPGRHHQEL